jgi:hypothetical protein
MAARNVGVALILPRGACSYRCARFRGLVTTQILCEWYVNVLIVAAGKATARQIYGSIHLQS